MDTNLRPGYFGDGSVEVSVAKPGEGAVRRLAIMSGELRDSPLKGIETIPDILAFAAQKYKNMKAAGTREVVKVHEEKKEVKSIVEGREVTKTKTWQYFELSEPKFISYNQLQIMVSEVARALVVLGITTDDIFNVYSQTCLSWQIMSNACALISTTIATAYDTLGESGLAHSLNEPESVGLFTNADLLSTVLKVLPTTPTVKFIVYDGLPSAELLDKLHAIRSDIRVLSITELQEMGKTQPSEVLKGRLPTKDTIACIMYTSGSTGSPKGVTITHSNAVATVASIFLVFEPYLPAGDAYLAYLPLAHVLEYVVELAAIFVGITLCYARPKTLTDASVRHCLGDLNTYKPTIMFGVPTVWETIRKGVMLKIQSGGALKQAMFYGAMALKRNNVPILGRIADNVVLSKVRAATGGRLRFAMNGGAAINKDTQEFLSLAIMPMMQGYGMTETCGMCTLLPPEMMQHGVVGLPAPSVEIKLIDIPEAGYLSSNTPPQGEVCVRGPSVTKGYFKRPDLNEDESIFTKDGWLRTGDVGQWNPDGALVLIDRLKNLVKLQSGEYIALEQLESIYKSCNYATNLCVHASIQAKMPMAIVVPNEASIRHALKSTDLAYLASTDLAELCANDRIKDMILKDCNELGRKNGFKGGELLCAVVLSPIEWTAENGMVTPAQKLRRNAIAKEFAEQIKVVYESQ